MAVVGVADALKGQVPWVFVVPKADGQGLAQGVQAHVDAQLGAVARPARVLVLPLLPKTRSGKLLRRAMQAVCEGRDTGDLSTIEDAGALHGLKAAVAGG